MAFCLEMAKVGLQYTKINSNFYLVSKITFQNSEGSVNYNLNYRTETILSTYGRRQRHTIQKCNTTANLSVCSRL